MTDANERPPWSDFLIYSFREAHNFCAARIRQKLTSGADTNTLMVEADEMVRRDIGEFPSEEKYDPYPDPVGDVELERGMREIAVRNYESLVEAESYLWGLGIAGVVHQWEKDTRQTVMSRANNPPPASKLNRMDFSVLCSEVVKTGFAITAHPGFRRLRVAWLIANTIKHGDGPSFSELLAERRDLFTGGSVGVQMGDIPSQAANIRVGQVQFDDAVEAIDAIWSSYEDADLKRTRSAKVKT